MAVQFDVGSDYSILVQPNNMIQVEEMYDGNIFRKSYTVENLKIDKHALSFDMDYVTYYFNGDETKWRFVKKEAHSLTEMIRQYIDDHVEVNVLTMDQKAILMPHNRTIPYVVIENCKFNYNFYSPHQCNIQIETSTLEIHIENFYVTSLDVSCVN